MNFLDALRLRSVPHRPGTRNPAEVNLCCPFCVERGQTADARFRLGFNVASGKAHCFNCDWKARNAWGVIGKRLFADVVLDDEESVGASRITLEEKEEIIELPEGFFQFRSSTHFCSEFIQRGYDYLISRSVAPWQIQMKKIGVTLTGRYRFRVVLPVYWKKKLVGIISRDFTDTSTRKYLNSGVQKSMYNLPNKKSVAHRSLVLVEGPFDALVAERAFRVACADYDVGAVQGHTLTEFQDEQIRSLGYRHFVLWPDPDKVGIRGFLQIAHHLPSVDDCVEVVLPAKHDVGEFKSSDAVLEHFRHRKQVLTPLFELELLRRGVLHG
jgi:hypothetical protein